MAESSNIEWTDSTFNPWIGCQKVSPACDNCYAEAMFDTRLSQVEWGPGKERKRTSASNWRKPRQWQKAADEFRAEHGRDRFVFCASLADVFDNAVPESWRADLFDLIRECDRLTWLILTKRPTNIRKMLPDDWGDGWPHVWLGTTVENQDAADRNVPALLETPAAMRFLSCEPLLGPVDLQNIEIPARYGSRVGDFLQNDMKAHPVTGLDGKTRQEVYGPLFRDGRRVDWVIAGGESGNGARPPHPDWIRSLRDQCASARVPFLFKQWGEYAVSEIKEGGAIVPPMPVAGIDKLRYSEGGEAFKPPPLGAVVSEIIKPGNAIATKCGKSVAGRVLDGAVHDGRPSNV